jgi:hypothetical protein
MGMLRGLLTSGSLLIRLGGEDRVSRKRTLVRIGQHRLSLFPILFLKASTEPDCGIAELRDRDPKTSTVLLDQRACRLWLLDVFLEHKP